MKLHKEGHKLLIWLFSMGIAIIYGAIIFYGDVPVMKYGIIGVYTTFFLVVLQFFRIPKRTIPINPKHIIAPADGKVVVIEETEETEYFKDKRRQVSIFMSPINVHNNRTPVTGIVKFFKYHPGKFLVAWHPKASTENERTTVVVENESGVEVLFRQIAGALAKRICWYIDEGDKVIQGEEFGFIKFGSRVDLFLPLDAKILVNLDQKSIGGETVIAELV